MNRFLILTLTLFFSIPIQSGAEKPQTQASEELKALTDKLGEGVKDKPGVKIAVLEFAYTSGKVSDGP